MAYLEWRRKQAARTGEDYGSGHQNEPESLDSIALPHPGIALLPLVAVGVLNKLFADLIPAYFGESVALDVSGQALTVQVSPLVAIWAVQGTLLGGILCVLIFA